VIFTVDSTTRRWMVSGRPSIGGGPGSGERSRPRKTDGKPPSVMKFCRADMVSGGSGAMSARARATADSRVAVAVHPGTAAMAGVRIQTPTSTPTPPTTEPATRSLCRR
jgi:hypothetical protein